MKRCAKGALLTVKRTNFRTSLCAVTLYLLLFEGKLQLGQAEHYKYLNQGKCTTIAGVSDTAQFEITKVSTSRSY